METDSRKIHEIIIDEKTKFINRMAIDPNRIIINETDYQLLKDYNMQTAMANMIKGKPADILGAKIMDSYNGMKIIVTQDKTIRPTAAFVVVDEKQVIDSRIKKNKVNNPTFEGNRVVANPELIDNINPYLLESFGRLWDIRDKANKTGKQLTKMQILETPIGYIKITEQADGTCYIDECTEADKKTIKEKGINVADDGE